MEYQTGVVPSCMCCRARPAAKKGLRKDNQTYLYLCVECQEFVNWLGFEISWINYSDRVKTESLPEELVRLLDDLMQEAGE